LVLLGVDYLDNNTPALTYLQQFGVTYPNGIDLQERIAKSYRITGVPETFIIDKQGKVRDVIIEPTTEARLTATVQKLIDE